MSAIVWLIIGVGLVLAEFAAPGIVLVFFGAAAISVAALAAAGVTESVAHQMGAFAFLSVIYLVALRDVFKRWFMGHTSDQSDGSGVMQDVEGQRVRVLTDFDAGQGTVLLNGVKWNARCDTDLKAGQQALVTGKSSLILLVTPEEK